MTEKDEFTNKIRIYESQYHLALKLFDESRKGLNDIQKKAYEYITILGLYFVVLTLFIKIEFDYFFPFQDILDCAVIFIVATLLITGFGITAWIIYVVRIKHNKNIGISDKRIEIDEIPDEIYSEFLKIEVNKIYEITEDNRELMSNSANEIKITNYLMLGFSCISVFLIVLFISQVLSTISINTKIIDFSTPQSSDIEKIDEIVSDSIDTVIIKDSIIVK